MQETDPTRAVLDAIARHDVADAIVRVQIAISERLAGLLNDGEIRRALKDAHFIAAISRDVARERLPRMVGWSAEKITPLEALEEYLKVKKPDVDHKLLLEYGASLIRESESEE